MQVGQRGLLRDKHLPQMWGLSPLSGATVLPSHLLQTHLFLLFCPPANKFCHQPKLHKTSKRHPQHGIEFVGVCWGQVGSGWSILGGGGSLSVITPSTRQHSTPSLGRRWTRIPRILFPVASLALSLVKPALNLFLSDQSLDLYPFPFAVRHVFFTTIWNSQLDN